MSRESWLERWAPEVGALAIVAAAILGLAHNAGALPCLF